MCRTERHQATPIGVACVHCAEAIAEGDQGMINDQGYVWHLDCFLRGIFGGVNHQRGTCTCCGGDEPPDPPGLTRREAARQAVAAREQADATWAALQTKLSKEGNSDE